MGGCAGKPKELELDEAEAPENPDQKAEGENVAQEKNEEGGEKENKEEPLLDLSEPKEAEPLAEIAPVLTEDSAEAEKPKEEKVEAKVEETKVEAQTVIETKEPAKDDQVEATTKVDPITEDKSDAPLVTV